MFRLFFGALIGAALMYLFDPRQGRQRRETLSTKVHDIQHRAEDAAVTGRDAIHQAKETAAEARERARSTISHAQDRFSPVADEAAREARATATEAMTEAERLAESTQERVRSAKNDGEAAPL
jgi:gas vesicle protein